MALCKSVHYYYYDIIIIICAVSATNYIIFLFSSWLSFQRIRRLERAFVFCYFALGRHVRECGVLGLVLLRLVT